MHNPNLPRYHGHTWLSTTKKVSLFLALFLLAGFVVVYIRSGQFVARGIHFQEKSVAGMTREELFELVSSRGNTLVSREVIIDANHVNYRLTPAALAIRFDAQKTVESAFNLGRSLWLKADIAASDGGGQRHFVLPVLATDKTAVREALTAQLSAGERPVQDARVVFSAESGWTVSPASSGYRLAAGEADRLTEALLHDVYDPAGEALYYTAAYDLVEPTVPPDEVQGLLAQAKALTLKPLTIHFGKLTETVDFKTDASRWLTFDYSAKTVGFDEAYIKEYAETFAVRHEQAPSTVTVKSVEEFISEYSNSTYKKAVIDGEFKSGRRVDREKLAAELVAVLADPAAKREVTADADSVPATVLSEVPGLTFPGIVSIGKSSFHYGNKPNRVHNIKRALEFQDLTVIERGATFSYNEVLGWVSYEKGYVDGQVIFGNSLANVPGGGVCQTSTTMFRAAVNAGLPVVERSNHTWDVHYYQDWHGVDAAVYPPGKLDLVFVNDTPGPLLVHSFADEETENAYFELYGTADGRTVATETVENYRVGAGRKIIVNWDVTYADGAIESRQIVSRYKR